MPPAAQSSSHTEPLLSSGREKGAGTSQSNTTTEAKASDLDTDAELGLPYFEDDRPNTCWPTLSDISQVKSGCTGPVVISNPRVLIMLGHDNVSLKSAYSSGNSLRTCSSQKLFSMHTGAP
jgi:hypothetical protein